MDAVGRVRRLDGRDDGGDRVRARLDRRAVAADLTLDPHAGLVGRHESGLRRRRVGVHQLAEGGPGGAVDRGGDALQPAHDRLDRGAERGVRRMGRGARDDDRHRVMGIGRAGPVEHVVGLL